MNLSVFKPLMHFSTTTHTHTHTHTATHGCHAHQNTGIWEAPTTAPSFFSSHLYQRTHSLTHAYDHALRIYARGHATHTCMHLHLSSTHYAFISLKLVQELCLITVPCLKDLLCALLYACMHACMCICTCWTCLASCLQGLLFACNVRIFTHTQDSKYSSFQTLQLQCTVSVYKHVHTYIHTNLHSSECFTSHTRKRAIWIEHARIFPHSCM